MITPNCKSQWEINLGIACSLKWYEVILTALKEIYTHMVGLKHKRDPYRTAVKQ